jgi:hypothetical protein
VVVSWIRRRNKGFGFISFNDPLAMSVASMALAMVSLFGLIGLWK